MFLKFRGRNLFSRMIRSSLFALKSIPFPVGKIVKKAVCSPTSECILVIWHCILSAELTKNSFRLFFW